MFNAYFLMLTDSRPIFQFWNPTCQCLIPIFTGQIFTFNHDTPKLRWFFHQTSNEAYNYIIISCVPICFHIKCRFNHFKISSMFEGFSYGFSMKSIEIKRDFGLPPWLTWWIIPRIVTTSHFLSSPWWDQSSGFPLKKLGWSNLRTIRWMIHQVWFHRDQIGYSGDNHMIWMDSF